MITEQDQQSERSPHPGLRHFEHVMGNVFSFDVRDPVTHEVGRAVTQSVAWLHEVDALFSTFREDSAVNRLSRGETTVEECPAVVAEVLALCEEASRDTKGFFTATPRGRLDPSGLVMGWSVEHVSRTLYAAGAHNTYIDAGGDLQLRGEASPDVPWRVGIAHPVYRDQLIAVVHGHDLGVATSGSAERSGHIIDPRTGLPASELLSVTVAGPSLARADVLATAAFAMGNPARSWIESQSGYEALAVTAEGETWQSSGFPS
ncbi:FAD:protein FMN transferase [Streptomyces sp. NPDC002018]|uniref:FAD:protein FMN transferase n=1 Tax=Streptomyces sp. NPDC002018 TaxID=3364629 RepID=UPI0036AE0EFE